MRDLPRLLYPLTFFSLRQVGGFCRKPVSQWGPIQKSQGHSADDIKFVTEKNGRPSMNVHQTMNIIFVLAGAVTSYPAPPSGQLPLG